MLLALQDSLAAMWRKVSPAAVVSAGAGPSSRAAQPQHPESIADLRLGTMLHEFTERKHAQLQLLLEHGRRGTARLLAQAAAATRAQLAQAATRRRGQARHRFKAEQEQRQLARQARQPGGGEREQPVLDGAAAAPSAATATQHTAGAFSTAADFKKQRMKKQQRERGLRQAAAAAAAGGDEAAGAATGFRGIITQVQRREQQREQDIRRRWGCCRHPHSRLRCTAYCMWRSRLRLPCRRAPPCPGAPCLACAAPCPRLQARRVASACGSARRFGAR